MEKIGFFGATLIGIGAIVGGGIFVLGGVALVQAGPGAPLAIFLSGLLALLTARSTARISRLFPESGGAYLYAKRVFSIPAAFVLGWMLWLAHIVAALLYALGFGAYFSDAMIRLWPGVETLVSRHGVEVIAGLLACSLYSWQTLYRLRSDSALANILKVLLFIGLVLTGCFMMLRSGGEAMLSAFQPLAPQGIQGIFAAMGYTFIALQGFELIASSSGDIRDPQKTVGKAMYSAVAVALIIYIPLLVIVIAIGMPEGLAMNQWCQPRPETCLADAFQRIFGNTGYWVVSVAALVGTLTALQANIVASARTAFIMASDRTLPRVLGRPHELHQTPEIAILINVIILFALILTVPNASAAGSAASLAFLICFTIIHFLSMVVSYRGRQASESSGLVAILPALIGGLCCFGLVLFQLTIEISGAQLLIGWVSIGCLVYYLFLSTRAEALDAFSQANNPELFSYRSLSSMILIPITNPTRVPGLISIARLLSRKGRAKLLLLSIANRESDPEKMSASVASASAIISSGLQLLGTKSQSEKDQIDGVVSIQRDPFDGISRVARTYDCETVLLGFRGENSAISETRVRSLLQSFRMNVVMVSSPPEWSIDRVRRVLVPIGGKGDHDRFRARILGACINHGIFDICFLRLLPASTTPSSLERVSRALEERIKDETQSHGTALVKPSENVQASILAESNEETLVILGLSGQGVDRGSLGSLVTGIAENNPGATLIIRYGA